MNQTDTATQRTKRNWLSPFAPSRLGRSKRSDSSPSSCKNHYSRDTRFGNRSGWSLIEVIATIVLAAVLVTLLLPLIGSGLQGSRNGLLRMPATYSLRSEMDDWWQTYRTLYPTDLPGLSTEISTAATDAAPYSVLYNDWVDFDATGLEFVPAPGTENVLRVTLGNAQGERLTAYFFPIP